MVDEHGSCAECNGDWLGVGLHDPFGAPVEPRNLARSFARLVEAAGLRPIRLHDLRHTVASLLKKLQTAPNDAKEILGHARISMVGIYTR